MFSFIARRVAAAVGTLFLSSVLVFLAVQALPGDVATRSSARTRHRTRWPPCARS